MTQKKINEILVLHKKWLNNEEGGKCANLSNADLSNAYLGGANLRGANLRGANLSNADLSNAYLGGANLSNADLSNAYLGGANLRCANLSYANLRGADLSYADLSNVDLRGANLSYADLSNVDLRDANLRGANLSYADLSYANLSYADLSNANLSYANLSYADLDEKEQCRKGIILKKKLIAYKKLKNDVIATLEIPKGAIVFSINNSKCRTNKAKCIALSDDCVIGYSNRDCDFTYEINKKYEIEDFDLMYNVECANGIHFFKTIDEAEDY